MFLTGKPAYVPTFSYIAAIKVPLRQKFVGLFRPNSVAEYRVVSVFTQKTEQETVYPNMF